MRSRHKRTGSLVIQASFKGKEASMGEINRSRGEVEEFVKAENFRI